MIHLKLVDGCERHVPLGRHYYALVSSHTFGELAEVESVIDRRSSLAQNGQNDWTRIHLIRELTKEVLHAPFHVRNWRDPAPWTKVTILT